MAEERNGQSLPDLFSDVLNQVTNLFRTELRLAKAELGEKVGDMASSAGMIIAGAVLLVGAKLLLLQGFVLALVALGIPPLWSTFAVAILIGLIGYLVVRKGLSNLSVQHLTPERTLHSLNRDAAVAKEQVQ
jgi:hypothetical protein